MNKNDSKKFISNLVVLILIGVGLVILNDFYFKNNETESTDSHVEESIQSSKSKSQDNFDEHSSNDLEKKLKVILSEVKGVGNVNIMINLEDTEEIVPVFNTTTINESTSENDSQGGVRSVSREDLKKEVVTSNGNSLMTTKRKKPNVKGVIVVAEGAEDPLVKEKIYSAVKTVLGISTNKVEVYSSK